MGRLRKFLIPLLPTHVFSGSSFSLQWISAFDLVDQIFSNLFLKFSLYICSKNFQQSVLRSCIFVISVDLTVLC